MLLCAHAAAAARIRGSSSRTVQKCARRAAALVLTRALQWSAARWRHNNAFEVVLQRSAQLRLRCGHSMVQMSAFSVVVEARVLAAAAVVAVVVAVALAMVVLQIASPGASQAIP